MACEHPAYGKSRALAARVDPEPNWLLPMFGKVGHATSTKARRVLGWQPRSSEDALVATAGSLLALNKS